MRRSILAFFVLLTAATPAAATSWEGGGPELGWVTALLRPFGPDGPLYAGTYGGGIWRSDDDGARWSEATDDARDAVVWNLAIGDDANRSLYAATEDRDLLRSENFSSRWSLANTGLDAPLLPGVFDVAVFPEEPTRIAAATGSGARISRTRGDAWADTLRVGPIVPVRAVEILPDEPNTVYYLAPGELGYQRGSRGIVQSFDAGLPGGTAFFDFAPWPGDPSRFVVADFDGTVWSFKTPGFSALGTSRGAPRPDHFYRVDVSESPEGPVIRVGSDRGLYVSTDEGNVWDVQARGSSAMHAEVWEVMVDDPASGVVWLGSFRDGVLRAVPGLARWQERNTGLRAAWVRGVDLHDGILLAATQHGRLFRRAVDGTTWDDVTGDLDVPSLTTIAIAPAGTWIVGSSDGPWVSDDEGTTWSRAAVPAGVTRLNAIVVAAAGRLLAASDDGLLESLDAGRAWSHVAGLDARGTATAVTFRDGWTAVGFSPIGGDPGGVFVDRDGAGFVALDVGSGIRPRGLAFAPDGGFTLVVVRAGAGSANLLRITDLETPSPQISTGRVGPAGQTVLPSALVAVPATRRLVAATAAHGVFVSDDAGLTWTPRNGGLVTLRCEDLAVDGARVAVGTFARGAWTRTFDDLVALDDAGPDDAAPVRVDRLFAPAPNPFNPRTTLRWQQTEAVDVTVEVFDLRGRRVATLWESRLQPGRHQVTWDGADAAGRPVASGTYVARVQLGQRSLTAPLTLVR